MKIKIAEQWKRGNCCLYAGLIFVLLMMGVPSVVFAVDADGDGYTVEQGDCDDSDASVWTGSPEVCDGKDNNCDGRIDEVRITEIVSVDSSGNYSNGYSGRNSISGDGQLVAFASSGSNLVEGDTNGSNDIFVHDRQSGITERVSVDSAGIETQGGGSEMPSISWDGRYVAYESRASNLVQGDVNSMQDIFVHDRQTGVTERVSVHSSGVGANGINAVPVISGDGRYVTFQSEATNLVDGDTNGVKDVFVHDRDTGITERVSVDSAGAQGDGSSQSPSISGDGRYVVFSSGAANLVSGDTNNAFDVFIHDLQTGITERVSTGFYASISYDGRYVAFINAKQVYVYDRQTGAAEHVSVDYSGIQGNGRSIWTSISGDGRYVAFYSEATNLIFGDVNGWGNIYVYDRETRVTRKVSVDSYGTEGDNSSIYPSISSDGRYVAFSSEAENLVNGASWLGDIYVHDYFGTPGPWFADNDGDGYGDPDSMVQQCNELAAYVVMGGDCDDRIIEMNPGRHEILNNGIDDDCNPATPDDGVKMYVEPAGLCGGKVPCYQSIQQAINDASDGHVIFVAQGVYNESVVLGSIYRLLIQGGWDSGFMARNTDPSKTVIAGIAEGSALRMDIGAGDTAGGEFTVEGMELRGGGSIGLSGFCQFSDISVILTNMIVRGTVSVGGAYSDISLYITDSVVSDSAGDGISLYNNGGNATLSVLNSTIERNKIGINVDNFERGSTTAFISNNTIRNNLSRGINIEGAMSTIENNIIDNNKGGGVAIGGATGKADISRNTIINNTANSGGGIAVNPSGPNYSTVTALLTHNVIKNNYAYSSGGALVLGGHQGYSSKVTSINNMYIGNRASNGGAVAAGAYRGGYSISFLNDTLAGNIANNGGAIYSSISYAGGGSHVITNSIVRGNIALIDGDDIFMSGSDAGGYGLFLSHSNIGEVITTYGPASDDGTNLNVDPQFVSPGSWDDNGTPLDISDDIWTPGDYHIMSTSPMIDAGDIYVPKLPVVDYEGDPRISGNAPDIGADEYWEGSFPDDDGDGYTAYLDCNDADASINPGASEGPYEDVTCGDGIDNNCNGFIDLLDKQCQPLPPTPDIKVNGQDGKVVLLPGDEVSVTVSLDAGDYINAPADWWVKIFFHDAISGSMVPIDVVDYHTGLFDLAPTSLVNTPVQEGMYVFYFGVDMNQNNVFDPAQMHYDTVVVHVRPDAGAGIHPTLDMKINGMDRPVDMSEGDSLTATVSMDAGDYLNAPADWWVKLYFYDAISGGMVPIDVVDYHTGLFDLPSVDLLSTPVQKGFYMFWFGVDTDQNSSVDMDQMFFDAEFLNVR
ncbi:PD40 domain-containing protein [bacterium]|nr:PD40 domain-containing protein [bacterium]